MLCDDYVYCPIACCQAFGVHFCAVTRKYELNRRAERQAETRLRIVEATVGLHTSVGPAQATVSAIAERAGVQRHTVYAHFRDEPELFDACSAHWAAPPSLPGQRSLERTSTIRCGACGWRWTPSTRGTNTSGTTWISSSAIPGVHVTTAALVERRERGLLALRDGLAVGWSRRKPVRAAIGHALELETWHSLVRRHGLTRKQAVDAMLRFVASV